MKQHITKQQWNELSEKLKLKVLKAVGMKQDKLIPFYLATGYPLTIGQMIDFLGDDFYNAITRLANEVTGKRLPHDYEIICDNLWEAVKDKLKWT